MCNRLFGLGKQALEIVNGLTASLYQIMQLAK